MKKGFTLIELLIVLAIIGTLVAMAVVRFAGLAADRNVTVCQANLRSLNSAVAIYRIAEDQWPTDIYDLADNNPPYMLEVPSCPGGGTYSLVEGVVPGEKDRAKCSEVSHTLPAQ